MNEHILNTETQATLLLCGYFGNEPVSAKPLSLSEYNKFEQWLSAEGLPLSALTEAVPEGLMERLRDSGFDMERLSYLLNRGSAMAIAVEQWTNIGLWVMCRRDEAYPECFKSRLKHRAPAILYGAGNRQLLSRGGLAVVGSRDADESALSFARAVGDVCAQQNIQIISGGARGVDNAAMLGALERSGSVIGILSGNLAKETVSSRCRTWLSDEQLVLVSSFHPKAGFNVGSAMERNKQIYVMADYSFVVSSDLNKGGTWQGAIENLKQGWSPLFVRDEEDTPAGNRALIKRGGIPIEPSAIELDTLLLDKFDELVKSHGLAQTSRDGSPQPEEQLSLHWSPKETAQSPQEPPKKATSFDELWPSLVRELREEKTNRELADKLGIPIEKIRRALNRAVELGRVKKQGRPARYSLTMSKNDEP